MSEVMAQMDTMKQQMQQMQQMFQMQHQLQQQQMQQQMQHMEVRRDSPRPPNIKAKEPHGYSGDRREDLSLWAMAVNTYLELQNIVSEDLRVKAASQFLTPESHAQKWFRDNFASITSWEHMQSLLSDRFVVTDHHDQACLSLLALSAGEHKLNLQDYNTEFQRCLLIATSKPGWELPAAWQVLHYRQGLKNDQKGLEMKKAILQGKVTSLKDAITAAVAVDSLLQKVPATRGPDGRFREKEDPMELGTTTFRSQVKKPDYSAAEQAEIDRRQKERVCMQCGEAGHLTPQCGNGPVGSGAQKYAKYRKALDAAIAMDEAAGNGPPPRKGHRGGRGGGRSGRGSGRG